MYCSTHFSWCWLLFYATVTYKLLLRFTDSAFLIDILHSLSMNWPIKVQDDHKLHYSLQFFLKQNSFDHFDYNYALLFWNLDGMFFRMMSFCWFCKMYQSCQRQCLDNYDNRKVPISDFMLPKQRFIDWDIILPFKIKKLEWIFLI